MVLIPKILYVSESAKAAEYSASSEVCVPGGTVNLMKMERKLKGGIIQGNSGGFAELL